jgi:hypothetical protein
MKSGRPVSEKVVWLLLGIANVVIVFLSGWASRAWGHDNVSLITMSLVILVFLGMIEVHVVPLIGWIDDKRLFSTQQEDIIKRSEAIKSSPKLLYAVWAFSSWDYRSELKSYFEQERKLLSEGKTKIQRIIDPEKVDSRDILEHAQEFKEYLLNGSYRLSLQDAAREMLIADRQTLIIYWEALTGGGAGTSAGPLKDQAVVTSHVKEYEDAFRRGRVFVPRAPESFDADLNEWIGRLSTPPKL